MLNKKDVKSFDQSFRAQDFGGWVEVYVRCVVFFHSNIVLQNLVFVHGCKWETWDDPCSFCAPDGSMWDQGGEGSLWS